MQSVELDQFLSILSHDLRAPLRHVTQFASLLKDEIDQAEEDSYCEYTEAILLAAGKMEGLLDDLLQFFRIVESRSNFEEFDMQEMIEEVLASLKDCIQDCNAEIMVDVTGTCIGDRKLITICARHLIENALKFRNDHLPTIVRITTEKVEGAWCINVSDNGIGIEPKFQSKIFQLFQKLHSEKDYPGRGAGLAICKKIAEVHKGTLTVSSARSRGSIFTLSLPETLVFSTPCLRHSKIKG